MMAKSKSSVGSNQHQQTPQPSGPATGSASANLKGSKRDHGHSWCQKFSEALRILFFRSQVTMGLSIISISLLLLTGCVPGGYSVDSLSKQPEAGLTYPGSTDVHTDNYNGSPGNWISKGGVASTGKSGTTTDAKSEVAAYYSQKLNGNGWTQTMDNPDDTLASGLPGHVMAWENTKLKLSYEVDVWVEGETTKYFSQLRAND